MFKQRAETFRMMVIALSLAILFPQLLSAATAKDQRRAKELVDYAVSDLIPAKDYTNAIKYLDAALMYDADMWRGYAAKGYCQYILGDYENSLANYERAQRINPSNQKINDFIVLIRKKLAAGRLVSTASPTPFAEPSTGPTLSADNDENYRTSDSRPPRKGRRHRKYIKTHARRSWGIQTSLIYLKEDSLHRAARNMELWARNVGLGQFSAASGSFAKSIALLGGMRAGSNFRLISVGEYIFGHGLDFRATDGADTLSETIETSAFVVSGGFEYLMHSKKFDLGIGLRLGMLEGRADFTVIEDYAGDPFSPYAISGQLEGSNLCFMLDSRLEHYFARNFSLFGALSYQYAHLGELVGYTSFGEAVALLNRHGPDGDLIVIDYAILADISDFAQYEYTYADINFGGIAMAFGLEVHY